MLTLNQSIYCAAIKCLEEEYQVDPCQVVSTTFDPRPQHNEDGSITHCLSMLIHHVVYDVEVYQTEGWKFEADCWQINGQLNDQLVLKGGPNE